MTSEIWIAEDDRSLRWVMEKAIRREDIKVRSFENGEDLLEALVNDQPEIIISDIRMPGMDGLELLQRIHADHPNMPIIITTAHSDLDSAVAAYHIGAFEYLPKPFDLEDLVDGGSLLSCLDLEGISCVFELFLSYPCGLESLSCLLSWCEL